MEEKYLSNKDISLLLKESRKLALGEMAFGEIFDYVAEASGKKPKVIANFTPKANFEEPLSFKTSYETGSNSYALTGKIYPKAFKKTAPYHLKKYTLPEIFTKLYEKIKLAILNQNEPLQLYVDAAGRIFLLGELGSIYYLNSTKNACINIYGEYCELIKKEDGYYFEVHPEIKVPNFDYLYITKKRKLESGEKEEELSNPYVTDIIPYLDGGPRR